MCPASEQYRTVCKGEFSAIHKKLDRLDEAIRGNGKPGIMLRLDRLEISEATRRRLLWIIAAAVVTLAVAALWKLVIGG